MKKILFVFLIAFLPLYVFAQSSAERRVKAAVTELKRSAYEGQFTLLYYSSANDATDKQSGEITLKGNKFRITLGGNETKFDGKTQWMFVSEYNEVSITEPTLDELKEVSPLAMIEHYVAKDRISEGEDGVINFYPTEPKSSEYFRIELRLDKMNLPTRLVIHQKNGDKITVKYLVHSGELGNITQNESVEFIFADTLYDISGVEVDGNSIFNIFLSELDGINSGTYSENIKQVKEMIGYNSRSLVLADPKNYKNLINKFSFCGYNRTWCEEGSLIVNSIILKNYKLQLQSGSDYFSLKPSDFFLNQSQKDSIINYISNSGQQLAGTVLKIFDPELCKYAAYVYIKTKTQQLDQKMLETKIRTLIGDFFSNVQSDIFIPKSDIVHLLKDNISEIDSVDVYFISEKNETALKERKYENL